MAHAPDHRLGAPGADLGQARVAFDFDAPALVVGQVPVEDVQLVQRQQVDVALDKFHGHEMAAHVQHAAAPAEARPIFDLDAGQRPGNAVLGLRREDLGREKLAQGLGCIQQPGRGRSAQQDPAAG